MSRKQHRGRLQAQGGGFEASENWAQDEPPTSEEGLDLLARLKEKIPKQEAEKREKQFSRAEDYIRRAGEHGGLDPHKKTFKEKETDVRVDIEILGGKAFVTLVFIILVLGWLLNR